MCLGHTIYASQDDAKASANKSPSISSRSLHYIVETGDVKALSAMLVGQVDVDMVNGVSMQLYRCD